MEMEDDQGLLYSTKMAAADGERSFKLSLASTGNAVDISFKDHQIHFHYTDVSPYNELTNKLNQCSPKHYPVGIGTGFQTKVFI